MRISRVLNCLNATGYQAYVRPLLTTLYYEAFETGALSCCRDSLARFWIKQLGDDWDSAANKEQFHLAFR